MKKVKIFISYARADEVIKNDLDKHLIGLKRSEMVEVWNDRELLPGEEWDDTIKAELEAADIILLLISADFNNSRYIWDNELSKALERHKNGNARVIPIIARTCDWQDMPYAKLQALPTGAKPISTYDDSDVANTEVATSIRKLVNFVNKK